MKKVYVIIFSVLSLILASCGNPDVDLTDSGYQPKIVVEAYLYAGQTVQDIKLSRNYRLGQEIDFNLMALTPSENSVSVTLNGNPLYFDAFTKTYYNSSITVEYGKTYKLEVSANIDGKYLHTTSTTTVPEIGFKLLGSKDLGAISYSTGKIDLQFMPSAKAAFYMFAFLADSASVYNYIYDNPYEERPDTEDVRDELNSLKSRGDRISNLNNDVSNPFMYSPNFFLLHFYSRYTTIVYAGDENFKNFQFTAKSVQEMDGNFHEPINVMDQDGIGVFGSAVKDTVYFTLVP